MDQNSTGAVAAEATSMPMEDVASEGYTVPGDREDLINGGKESPGKGEFSPLQLTESHEQDKSGQRMHEGLKIIIVSSIVFALSITVALILTIFLAPPPVAPHGAVSCSVRECSDLGTSILKKGGSAVDAAVATTLCVGVVNPQYSGMGGGGFMLVRRHAKNTTAAFDFRETAPSGASADMYKDNPDAAKIGGLAVGVPGELRGLALAHAKYGSLPWKDVVLPVAALARNGFPVTESLVAAISKTVTPGSPLAAIFFPNGTALSVGDTMRREDLARVLEKVAKEGAQAFYEGDIAQEIAQTVDDEGGILTEDDLAGYTAIEKAAIVSSFLNKTVEVPPSPSGGPILVLLLSILENYPLSKDNVTDNLYYHRLVEAISYAYAQKSQLGDPADPAIQDQISAAEALITNKTFARQLQSQIDDSKTQSADAYGVPGTGADQGTAAITVISPNEDMVAVQTSLNQLFGSQVVTPSGIILNNQMEDFDIDSSDPKANQNNLVGPGKRPLSSMTPTVLHTYNKPCGDRLVLAGVNGSRIISGLVEVILNLVAFQQDLGPAIEAARIHRSLSPDQLEYDSGFNTTVLQFLQDQGHTKVINDTQGVNMVNAAFKINETVSAHTDTRVSGPQQAAVY